MPCVIKTKQFAQPEIIFPSLILREFLTSVAELENIQTLNFIKEQKSVSHRTLIVAYQ